MSNLANRNLKMYLRDYSNVFFSFLAVIIIIGLYVLFLGQGMKDNLRDMPGGDLLMDIWVMAGIIAVTSFTTALGACSIIVEDRIKKNNKDFLSSPLGRSQIVGGYVLCVCAVALMMCLFAFVVAVAYLAARDMPALSFSSVLKILGVIMLSALSSSAVALFVASFIRTNGAYGGVSTLFGTLVGFLTGMYIPVGFLAENVQWAVKCFPTSHACALLRQIMMEGQIGVTFAGVPDEYVANFERQMGVVFVYGDYTATAGLHVAVLLGTVVVFLVLGLISLSRKGL
jgi:multidrug/hemolysin transport system permease protein